MIKIAHSSPAKNLMNQEAVQSMVHDFRTPITVIKANLQLLLSGDMGAMSSDQMMLLKRSMGPLEELILMTDNLLQCSTLENGSPVLECEETDLDGLLKDTVDFYSAPFKQREMDLYREGNSFGTKLFIDPTWMKRVLTNLIWNAYKFTPDHGKVTLQVRHLPGGLELVVEDNGRGIPTEKIHTIFEKYKQASPNRDRKLGVGLGLWICKRVLELHGGSISVHSQEGLGTRFVLTLPASRIL